MARTLRVSDPVFATWLLATGAVGGSAVAAFADRLAAGRSWLQGRSSCATCATPIGAGDLVPVVSFVKLKGRCRHCGTALPRRLLAAEIAGIACAAAALLFAPGPQAQVAGTVFLLLLLGLFLCDLQTMRLPDGLTGALALAGLWVGAQWHGAGMALLAALIGTGSLFLLARGYRALRGRDGLGAGDIKMMAGLAAMSGPFAIPWITLLAAAAALGVAVLRAAPVRATTDVPLGCYLACAGGLVWLIKSVGLA